MRSLLCLIEINGQRFYYIAVAVVVSLFVVVVVALGSLVAVVLVIAFN